MIASRCASRWSSASLFSVGLEGLREQDQRCRVGGLRREGEIQQDERVGIPAKADRKGVHCDPRDRLAGYVLRRAEEARCGLGATPEGVLAKTRTREQREPQARLPTVFVDLAKVSLTASPSRGVGECVQLVGRRSIQRCCIRHDSHYLIKAAGWGTGSMPRSPSVQLLSGCPDVTRISHRMPFPASADEELPGQLGGAC